MRPLVVALDSGATVRRPLVGIEPAAYQTLRARQANDQQLIAGQAFEIGALKAVVSLDSVTLARQAEALADTRRHWAETTSELNAQEVRTAQALALPSQKPLLLDGHTAIGAGAGALVLLLLKAFVH